MKLRNAIAIIVCFLFVPIEFARADFPVTYVEKTKFPEQLRKYPFPKEAGKFNFFEVKMSSKTKSTSGTAHNCEEYWKNLKGGLTTVSDGSDTIYPNTASSCDELKIRTHLQPAQKSFIDHKTTAFDQWPAAILQSNSEPAWFALRDRASRNGTSCKSYLRTLDEDKDDNTKCTATILAYGDWNGDGIEDQVITVSTCSGNYCHNDFLVVTQLKEDEPYRVIDGWSNGSDQFGMVEPDRQLGVESSIINTQADLSCAGDRLDRQRKEFNQLYAKEQIELARKPLKEFYDRCRSKLADNQKLWALSDLALAAFKLKDLNYCGEASKELKSIDLSHVPKKALSSLQFNLAKCK